MSLTLYYHPLASFCHKVLIALYENATEFEKRIINLGDEAQRAELVNLWPIGKFPVIRDPARDRTVAETTIIIEYLDRLFPGERPLIPHDWEEAMQVRLWDRICDHYLQMPMQQIVSDRMRGAQADLTQQRATIVTAYGMLNGQLASGSWAAHRDFTMADCAAAPALFYCSAILPLPPHLGHLTGYFEKLMARPSVRRVLEEAKPYLQYFPFADDIPKRFR